MYISFSISKNLVDRFKIWKNEEKEGCLAKKKKKEKDRKHDAVRSSLWNEIIITESM